MKFLSLILSVIMLFPSYFISFLPICADESFEINVKEFCAEREILDGKIFYSFTNFDSAWFNYFGVKYTSDSYMKGSVTYRSFEKELSEDFFLEPGENALFYSFIDGILENKKANEIVQIIFEPLDKSEADFELLGVGVFNREVSDEYVYIENSGCKIGINLLWGGALSYLEDTDSNVQSIKKGGRVYVDSNASERYSRLPLSRHVNLINRYDAGRLVQQSYYGTFNYENGTFMGNLWNYNPVQGGNQFNECSKIVDLIYTDSSIYVKCRPLDWAKSADCITPSYMEATYSIENGVLTTSCRFVDFSGLDSNVTTQEMPAFYCIEPFNRFVYYAGDKPWTSDDNLAYENKLIFWPDAGYPYFNSSENWAAFVGEFDDSFGIGLYVPNTTTFLAGVCDRENTTSNDPSVDGSTSYIAAIQTLNFESFKPIEYTYCIATGTVDEIRDKFNDIRN